MNAAEFLAKVSIFSHLKKRDLKRIVKMAQYEVFQCGEMIIKEGEQSGRLFVVISGKVDVIKNLGQKNESHLTTLGPQTYFGEMALLDDLTRTASVVAKTETKVLYIDHLNLREEIERNPVLAIELLQMLTRRLRAIEKTLVNTLGSLLPICAHCKKIRDENDAWVPIEAYISDHSETEFSHGICPGCVTEFYPELAQDNVNP